jgi:DNA (cytosine-5)-methyltransferase 1
MKPKMLDLFCCQGGAGMGYHQAGFDVYSVDIDPQPRNPFPFYQGDAVEVLRALFHGERALFAFENGFKGWGEWLGLDDISAVHASPPCQAKTKAQKLMGNEHPMLIGPTRELLLELGLPYVIENVVPEDVGLDPDPLIDPVMLCGGMFDLGTYRHRLFETNWDLTTPHHPAHTKRTTKMGRKPVDGEMMHVVGNFSGVEKAKQAMGIDWMTRDGLRESIPPAYTEYIGQQLMSQVIEAAA